MGEEEKEYDIEEDLKDVKDILRTEEIECPNCSSLLDPGLKKCSVCGVELTKPEDTDFTNRLKATMWAPKKDVGGVPVDGDVSPQSLSEGPPEDELEGDLEEPDSVVMPFPEEESEQEILPEGEELIRGFLGTRSSVKWGLSAILVTFGIMLYAIAAVLWTAGMVVLVPMVLGTIFVLIGGNLAFDIILERRRVEAMKFDKDLQESLSRASHGMLRSGSPQAKAVSVIIIFFGVLTYVSVPILVNMKIAVFVSMALGAVLIVFGVSFAHHAFLSAGIPVQRVRRKRAFKPDEASETEDPSEMDEFEWACPVCSAPLDENATECSSCGTEFED